MKASDLLPYVSYVLDTALSDDHSKAEIGKGTILVGWQCGFEPLVVAVIASYTTPDLFEAIEIATDYLEEKNWFSKADHEPDYVVKVPS